MGDPFVYLSEWQVLLCTSCGYCLPIISAFIFDENTPTRPLLAQPHSGENTPKLVTIKTSYKGSLLHHYVLL